MVSRKRSARAKQVAAFKAQLGADRDAFARSIEGVDSAFEHERSRASARERQREEALRRKACESKTRYSCESDARSAIRSCADHGTTGLRAYRCPYCHGWHLTSKPQS